MRWFWILLVGWIWVSAGTAWAQNAANTVPGLPFRVTIDGGNQPQDLDTGIKVLLRDHPADAGAVDDPADDLFTRIVIVLSFVRTALAAAGGSVEPDHHRALVVHDVFHHGAGLGVHPDGGGRALPGEGRSTSSGGDWNVRRPIRTFMLKQARPKDMELFVKLARIEPTEPERLPLKVVVPGFIISELRTAFQMGFLLLVPFILIDLVVAVVLMSMGMMMMPPDDHRVAPEDPVVRAGGRLGLVVRSLVQSFGS
jgi:flagellar biosynthetic protein FliP